MDEIAQQGVWFYLRCAFGCVASGRFKQRPLIRTAESVAMYCENMTGMHGLWWAFLIAIALVAVFVAWRVGAAAMWRNQPRETAHEILCRRLGSGDINTEEYEKRKALLDRDS